MPTPRSESIKKYLNNEASIRDPKGSFDSENKIDHYAVLARVMNTGVEAYLDNTSLHTELTTAPSVLRMGPLLSAGVNRSILATLTDSRFLEHYANLDRSQYYQHHFDASRSIEIRDIILGGANNFTSIFQYMYFSLGRLGMETATHPDNWKIADSLAKLNLQQFAAYRDTYLANYRNWPQLMDHFEVTQNGGVKFQSGYPGKAAVAVRVNKEDDLEEPDMNPEFISVSIKEMSTFNPTIGCPVTFEADIIKRLWELYGWAAKEITAPKQINSDDTGASPQ